MIKIKDLLNESHYITLEEAKDKKLLVIDFDDTLVKTKTNIIVRDKKTKQPTKELNSEQFAVYQLDSNEEFDFSNFNKIIKQSVPIKKNIELLKKLNSHPAWRCTILTARLIAYPVAYLLKKQYGIDVYVVGLGNADPQKKADYVERQIQRGYKEIVFMDDSIKNVNAVNSLSDKYKSVKLTTLKA